MSGNLEKTEKEAKGLTRQLQILTETTDSFAQSVIDASNESKKWTAVSRFLSGSGLWRLQNYLRGALQVMSFFNDSQKEAIEANIKQAQALSDLYDVQEESKKQMKLIKKIKDGGIDSINEEIAANDELAIAIQKQYKVIRGTIDQAIKDKKIQLSEEDAHAEAIRRTATAYEYVGTQIKKNMASRVKTFAKSIKNQMKLEEKAAKRKAELKEFVKLKGKAKAAKAAVKERYVGQDLVGGRVGRFKTPEEDKKQRADLKELVKEIRVQRIKQSKVLGVLSLGLTRGTTKGLEKEATKRQKLMQLLKTSPIGKGVINMKEQMKKGGKMRKIIQTVGGFAKKYMLLALLFLVGAFLVFSFIREILKNAEVMNTVMTALKEIFGGVMIIVSGFFDIFSAFFGGGTFGERLGTLLSGFMKIFGGLGVILWAVAKGVLKLAIGLVIGIITTYIKIIVGLFSKETWLGIWEKLKQKVFSKLGEWVTNLDIKGKLRSFFAGIINKWLGPINKVLGWFGAGQIQTMAKGGIAKGGLTLVGERGPELVNLPRGARVHSNAESRRMGGNTINVNVSGRVGASDSELRDIAKKIGRMVNTEINRTTSSSTNVRY